MSSPDCPVLLPSSFAWATDVRLVGGVLGTVGSAAACILDDTRYVEPALTWQIAAELVGDCDTTDHRCERVRAMSLPAYALDAVWACRTALIQVTDTEASIDAGSADLADLLSYCLECFHSTDLRSVIEALDRVLAVLTLDLPAARTLMTALVLSPDAVDPEAKSAFEEVLVAWRKAGVSC
ncbi:hypothetical protein [Streptomyces sp. NPDC059278]|uniref:hypothetical protein n=1 Tax=Streptomyces sp. NPDC059278 TaxID=3346801 RepID=UPI00368F4718